MDELIKNIRSGSKAALAKAITLIESSLDKDRKLAVALLKQLHLGKNKNSLRIGISGIPGVGKSTFIEALGSYILKENPKAHLAILTVDPSSPFEGGSILADRLRMTELSRHPQVFIRPSPTSGSLGGLALRTRESMLLLEATNFDFIFIETVGVGQTEFHVASLVDMFLLLQMPSTGDEWQAMKKGILELADMILINKADGHLITEAARLKKILQMSLHVSKQNILTCSALEQTGMKDIWESLISTIKTRKEKNEFNKKREEQNMFWFEEELLALFKTSLHKNEALKTYLDSFKKNLNDPLFSTSAEDALNFIFKKDFQKIHCGGSV